MRHSRNEVFNGSTRYRASVLPTSMSAVRGEAATVMVSQIKVVTRIQRPLKALMMLLGDVFIFTIFKEEFTHEHRESAIQADIH
jgi:hypothetical protein